MGVSWTCLSVYGSVCALSIAGGVGYVRWVERWAAGYIAIESVNQIQMLGSRPDSNAALEYPGVSGLERGVNKQRHNYRQTCQCQTRWHKSGCERVNDDRLIDLMALF